MKRPRILIIPLDWGLGHATRCVPIIYELINQGSEVLIGADKQGSFLLQKEFPNLVILRCKGYEIKYTQWKPLLIPKIILQLPRLLISISKEKRWLRKVVKKYNIDAVISDNRMGMFQKKIPSVYITHQLHIKTGNRMTNAFAQELHYYFIKKYSNCWVPDFKKDGLAGELSHPEKIPANVRYIGPLSRFTQKELVEKKYDLLIIISGPEPTRSIFEKKILRDLNQFNGNVLFVRGLPGESETITTSNSLVTIVNHLEGQKLNEVINQSKLVITRSGYTSVMDMALLGKNAVLIPTPGQTEQEYLAKYLFEKKYFCSTSEESFSLSRLLENVENFEFRKIEISGNDYKSAIHEFVQSLKSPNFASQ